MQVMISDAELDHLAELQDTWEEYQGRVRSVGSMLEQASEKLRTQLLEDVRGFDARCAQQAAQLHSSAPYDGRVGQNRDNRV